MPRRGLNEIKCRTTTFCLSGCRPGQGRGRSRGRGGGRRQEKRQWYGQGKGAAAGTVGVVMMKKAIECKHDNICTMITIIMNYLLIIIIDGMTI